MLLEDPATAQKITAKITELSPIESTQLNARSNTTDLTLISDADWQEAKRRESVLAPLAEKSTCSVEIAQQAGDQLGLTSRQIYNLLKRYRNYDYQLLSLLPQKPTGGKNKTRLKFSVEQIINNSI